MEALNPVIVTLAAVFGLIVGSFLNVVALRFNTGKSLSGRSECFSCGHVLGWKDLFPLFSFLFQRGRCRYCSSTISIDNIYAELVTATFFGLIAARACFAGGSMFTTAYLTSTVYLFVLFSILIVILLYDIKHKIIPDSLSLSFGVVSFLGVFFFGFDAGGFTYLGYHTPSLLDLSAAVLVPLPFALIWLGSRGRWIGLGDPKLMVGMGFLFGLDQGFSAVFLSFWVGALFALSLVIVNTVFKKTLLRNGKKSIMKSELPFAPFLIVATLVTIVLNFNLF